MKTEENGRVWEKYNQLSVTVCVFYTKWQKSYIIQFFCCIHCILLTPHISLYSFTERNKRTLFKKGTEETDKIITEQMKGERQETAHKDSHAVVLTGHQLESCLCAGNTISTCRSSLPHWFQSSSLSPQILILILLTSPLSVFCLAFL